jgi:hypothetical protein
MVIFFRTAKPYAQRKAQVNKNLSGSETFFRLEYLTRDMADLHKRLREVVKARFADTKTPPKWNRATLAARLGRANQAYINQWLDYEDQNPSINDLPVIAEFMDMPIEAFMGSLVPQSQVRTSPVRPSDQQSASHLNMGDATDAPETRLLRNRNAELEKENVALRHAIQDAHDILGVARAAAAGKTAEKTPRPRRHC